MFLPSIYYIIYYYGYNKCYTTAVLYKDIFVYRYRNFKTINNFVTVSYNGTYPVFMVSFCIVVKVLWMYIVQYLNSTVLLAEKNKYIITYVIKGKIYKMIVSPNRGPPKVLFIYDEKREDVSHLVFPYIGLEETVNSVLFTPKFFNRKELVFELSIGGEKIFRENEKIII